MNHPIPRKKRLLLTAEESEQWRNGTTEFRNGVRQMALDCAMEWAGRCEVVTHGGGVVYEIRNGVTFEDFATSLRDQFGKQCSVLNDAGRGGV